MNYSQLINEDSQLKAASQIHISNRREQVEQKKVEISLLAKQTSRQMKDGIGFLLVNGATEDYSQVVFLLNQLTEHPLLNDGRQGSARAWSYPTEDDLGVR